MATPRIQLKNVNGFPNEFHESGKILTANFIDASREIVFIFDKFGKLFTPVVKDMRGNVESLDAHYQKDVANRKFIEDMLLSEDGAVTRSWLLWLNRSLEMIERFFWFMLNNEEIISEKCDNVNHCVRQAYDVTLKPYHGFLLQSGFKLMVRYMPSRSSLFGSGAEFADNLNEIKVLQPNMKLHVDKIVRLYQENQFDDQETA